MNRLHIAIRTAPDGVDVVCDDWEVFDYVDDFLNDCGLKFESTWEEERDGRRTYIMHFGSGATEQQIAQFLEGVSAEEIERIWKLNN